jgi:Tfp pilus assembly protein PilF
MSDKVKVLFLSTNPWDKITRLRIDEEFRQISEKIRLATHRDHMELISEWAVRVGDLQAALLRYQPDIVHFSGHGGEAGGVMLEDEAGKGKVVDAKALSDLFRILKDNVWMVVLNACDAKDQAKELSKTVDFTIGMNAEIEDKPAIIFASHFYQSLAYGRSVREAFELAVNELALEGIKGAQVPELLERDGASASEARIRDQLMRRAAFEGRKRTHHPVAFLPWLFAGIALSMSIDVLRRFPGGDWAGIAAAIVQPILIALGAIAAALTVMSLVRPANPLVDKAASSGGFNEPRKARRAAILTGIFLAIALGVWLSLPTFARYYNERGAEFQYREEPDVSRARESYERAVRLNPSYAQAHYNLAIILEDLQPDKAIEQYLLAIKYDSHIYAAYNNLARLYLRRGKDDDYESALNILIRARELSPQDENVQYSLYKNLGWANYALANYLQAEQDLNRAISLQTDKAAAHCLLAYVLKAQGKAGAADECFDCVSLAPGETGIEASWVSDAQECLMEEESK